MNNPDGKIIIETEINTTKFDKQIDYLENKSRKLERDIENKKKVNVDTSEAEAELEKIRNKINSLSDKSIKVGLEAVSNIEFSSETIKNLGSTSLQFEGINGTITKINGNLDYVSSNIKEMKQDVSHLNEEIDEQPTRILKISEGFKKGLKQVKKYALALVGIRTAYSLVSKATSAYLDANEETANKLQSIWKVLGEAIGPVIDWIANSILKLVGYINEFVKAFTGGKVDLVAQANARAIANQTKAQEKLNKATQNYDFDVIRTQQDTTSSSTSSTSGLIEIPELNTKIVDKLKEIGTLLHDNWDIIKNIGIAIGVAFAVNKFIDFISSLQDIRNGLEKISGLFGKLWDKITGVASGLLGKYGALTLLKGALVGIAAAWTIYLYIKGYKEIKQNLDEAKQELSDMVEMEEYLTQKAKEHNELLRGQIENNELNDEQLEKIAKSTLESTKNIVESAEASADQTHWYQKILGLSGSFVKSLEEQNERVQETAKTLGELYNKGKINFSDYKEFVSQTLPAFRKQLERAGIDVSTLNEVINNLPDVAQIEIAVEEENARKCIDGIEEDLKTLPKTKEINVEVTATDKTQSVLDKIKSGFASIGSSISSLFTGNTKTKGYALGGIVTQPTKALIGEAGYNEYVLPEREDYLSRLASLIGQYSGGSGRATNVYLNGRLIQREMAKEENDRNFARNR